MTALLITLLPSLFGFPGAPLNSFSGIDLAPRQTVLDNLPLWSNDGGALENFPDQHVFRDTSGDIVIVYRPENDRSGRGTPRVIHYVLPNKVAPEISSFVHNGNNGLVDYVYKVRNESRAAQPITAWYLIGPSMDARVESDSGAWFGGATKTTFGIQVAIPYLPNGSYLSWMAQKQGISPGSAEGGFKISSPYLPGITTAYVRGNGTFTVPDELPLEVSDQLAPVDNLAVSSFITIAVGPRFPPNASATAILKGFRQDLFFLSEHSPQVLGDAEACKHLLVILDECLSTGTALCRIAPPQGANLLSDITRALQFDLQRINQIR